MDWKTLLIQILAVLAPLMATLAVFLTLKLRDYLNTRITSEMGKMVAARAFAIVLHLEQISVDALKAEGKWDDAAKMKILTTGKQALLDEFAHLTQFEAIQAIEGAVKKVTLAQQGPALIPTSGEEITADSPAL